MVKIYPSQKKYQENNPPITFRMKKVEKEKIEQLAKNSKQSVSQLVRESLLEEYKQYSDAYEKGHHDGFNDGSNTWGIWYYCTKCGEMIFIEPESNSHKAIIGYMREHGWGHTRCINNK